MLVIKLITLGEKSFPDGKVFQTEYRLIFQARYSWLRSHIPPLPPFSIHFPPRHSLLKKSTHTFLVIVRIKECQTIQQAWQVQRSDIHLDSWSDIREIILLFFFFPFVPCVSACAFSHAHACVHCIFGYFPLCVTSARPSE